MTKEHGSGSPLLTLPEASRFLRMSQSNVRARVAKGELPVIRYGGPGAKLFFAITDLQAFIEAHRRAGNGVA